MKTHYFNERLYFPSHLQSGKELPRILVLVLSVMVTNQYPVVVNEARWIMSVKSDEFLVGLMKISLNEYKGEDRRQLKTVGILLSGRYQEDGIPTRDSLIP